MNDNPNDYEFPHEGVFMGRIGQVRRLSKPTPFSYWAYYLSLDSSNLQNT